MIASLSSFYLVGWTVEERKVLWDSIGEQDCDVGVEWPLRKPQKKRL